MSSTRLILLFLGFILIIIIALSSGRIADALRSRFGTFIPQFQTLTRRPTPTSTAMIATPTPSKTVDNSNNLPSDQKNKGGESGQKGAVPGEIPATGPKSLVFLYSFASLLIGLALRKYKR